MAYPILPFREPNHYRWLSDKEFDELCPQRPRVRGFHKLVVPSFHPYEMVKNATLEERKAMHADWERRLREFNPGYFNEDGSVKKWWQVLLSIFQFRSFP